MAGNGPDASAHRGTNPPFAEPLTPKQAVAEQRRLRGEVRIEPLRATVTWLAAVDTGYANGKARAAAALYRWPELELHETRIAMAPADFPYVPGLLSFRELPAVLGAVHELSQPPDLILCDGQGIAHPRRLGIAAHLGVLLDVPTIGVGKSRLIGDYEEPGPEKGDWTPLTHHGERIGSVVRTRRGVKPLFVSPGHRVDHAQAVDWVLATTGRYRLPDPIRTADRTASQRTARSALKTKQTGSPRQ